MSSFTQRLVTSAGSHSNTTKAPKLSFIRGMREKDGQDFPTRVYDKDDTVTPVEYLHFDIKTEQDLRDLKDDIANLSLYTKKSAKPGWEQWSDYVDKVAEFQGFEFTPSQVGSIKIHHTEPSIEFSHNPLDFIGQKVRLGSSKCESGSEVSPKKAFQFMANSAKSYNADTNETSFQLEFSDTGNSIYLKHGWIDDRELHSMARPLKTAGSLSGELVHLLLVRDSAGVKWVD